MLILHDMTPWHWALAGAGIAIITLLLQYFGNRSLGLSSGLEDVCAVGSRLPYFRQPDKREAGSWRLPFLGGLITAGLLSAILAGGWSPTWALGLFDSVVGWGPAGKVALMFAGGLCIGFGTRLASGCTSGHGIFGVSNLQPASWVATICFMAAGIGTTNLLYRVVWA